MKDIFSELYKKVMSFFNNEVKEENSKDTACNRLKLVLMQDRAKMEPSLMEKMRDAGINHWIIGLQTAQPAEHEILDRPYRRPYQIRQCLLGKLLLQPERLQLLAADHPLFGELFFLLFRGQYFSHFSLP